MTTSIWLNDPRILLRNDKIRQLWPTEDMSAAEKVNAITRLVIILVTIGFLIKEPVWVAHPLSTSSFKALSTSS